MARGILGILFIVSTFIIVYMLVIPEYSKFSNFKERLSEFEAAYNNKMQYFSKLNEEYNKILRSSEIIKKVNFAISDSFLPSYDIYIVDKLAQDNNLIVKDVKFSDTQIYGFETETLKELEKEIKVLNSKLEMVISEEEKEVLKEQIKQKEEMKKNLEKKEKQKQVDDRPEIIEVYGLKIEQPKVKRSLMSISVQGDYFVKKAVESESIQNGLREADNLQQENLPTQEEIIGGIKKFVEDMERSSRIFDFESFELKRNEVKLESGKSIEVFSATINFYVYTY
ncbi:hypothetical protein HRbin34_00013 [bacterium HR34]|nr:hypothetical protein HRbin34_00013 [bacterium HR34]